ncbi:MAG: cob(I)yrinic acid a,c-diamide adenosyltransferase [Gammaproteobacteria bacterium]
MGHRLSRICTRTGDTGTTGLADGTRRDKTDVRIEALGEVDELNAVLGILLTHPLPAVLRDSLRRVQNDLFDLGGELALPGTQLIEEAHVQALERVLEDLNAELPPLKEFILPGGSAAAAACHLARTVCRRAERRVAALVLGQALAGEPLVYINRLSDVLFVMARVINRASGDAEVYWHREEARQ